jgi:hypothetical protein
LLTAIIFRRKTSFGEQFHRLIHWNAHDTALRVNPAIRIQLFAFLFDNQLPVWHGRGLEPGFRRLLWPLSHHWGGATSFRASCRSKNTNMPFTATMEIKINIA